LSGSDFSPYVATNSTATVTNLTGTRFDQTDVIGGNFTQANAEGVLINGLAVGANFTNAKFLKFASTFSCF
jgi:uncharacterized protein YjbI with pentapeptide repeats